MLVVMRTMLDEPLAPVHYDPQTTIVPLERWSNRTVIDTLIEAEYTCTFRDIQVNHVTAGGATYNFHFRFHRRTPVTVRYELRHARLVRHQDNPANMVELTEAVQLHSDDSVRDIIYSGHDVILGGTDISLGGIGPRDEVVHDFDVGAYRHLMDPGMKHSVLFDMYTVDGEFVGPAAFDIQ